MLLNKYVTGHTYNIQIQMRNISEFVWESISRKFLSVIPEGVSKREWLNAPIDRTVKNIYEQVEDPLIGNI